MLNLTQLLSFKTNRPTLRYSQENLPVVVWNLTQSCNLSCSFCYYDARGKSQSPQGINYNLAERIVKQLRQAKIKYLLLSGGEPLLYPKILNLIESITSSSIRIGISSNGTLIDKQLALDLKKAGLDYIGISLDGLKETHNRLRNSPLAFDMALAGLKHAREAGLRTGIRSTLNSYNYKQIKDIFSLAENLEVDRLCFYHLVYTGRARFVNYDLSKSERRKAIKLIIKLTTNWIKREIPTQVLTVDNFSDAVILLGYIRETKPQNYPSVLKLLRKQSGCPAGKRILSIDHLGFMHPCQFWNNHRLADLKKDNLSDVLNDGKLFNGWKTKLKGRCAVCGYKDICGGCRVRAYQAYGDLWQEDPCCCLKNNEIRNEANILERN